MTPKQIKALLDDIEPSLVNDFAEYMRENPTVWRAFKDTAFKARQKRCKYSGWAIVNYIRWNVEIEQGGPDFKISNDYIGLLSRLLERSEPEIFKGFFNLKEMKRVNPETRTENTATTVGKTVQGTLMDEPLQPGRFAS